MIRLLIADDQAMVREGFAALLDAQPDMEVAATAPDGHAAVVTARELRAAGSPVDVVLMDVRIRCWTAWKQRARRSPTPSSTVNRSRGWSC